MTTVLLIGALDTKAAEVCYLRERLQADGLEVIVLDVSGREHTGPVAELGALELVGAAGVDLLALRSGDRSAAVATLTRGARLLAAALYRERRISGAIGVGGSAGAVIATGAMQALPVGVPKVLVSPVAAGDTTPFVRDADITLMHPIIDLGGLNRVTRPILDNAAAAVGAMPRQAEVRVPECPKDAVPVAAATMFGITTAGVTAGRDALLKLGYEVQVFSANGAGGRALERRVADGEVDVVLDLTTTELADEVVGGIVSAGPTRLEAAGARGLPQVVSVGATDVVNFGPWATIPERFATRMLYSHNEAVTLMRTTPDEAVEIARTLARKLNRGRGRRCLIIPLRGTSTLSGPGGPFEDPEADRALVMTLRRELDPEVENLELDLNINDPRFGRAAAERLVVLHQESPATEGGT